MSINNINNKNIAIYQDEKGELRLEVHLDENNVWLTQAQMAELFHTTPQNITQHIKKIYSDNELNVNTTCKEFLQVVNRGFRGKIESALLYYNLDMIIAVGYRVRSNAGIAFRRWATVILREYIQKGFVLNDDRLKNGYQFDKEHFRELLDRIKDIRTSERMLYQQLKDIYALSEDYNHNKHETLIFFAYVQNKVHYAITGLSSAQIIGTRANAEKENMGLTTWKKAPNGSFSKYETAIAKNYLEEKEMSELKDVVNMFLDYAEMQAKAMNPIFMQDWIKELDNFLRFIKKPVLNGVSPYSRAQAVRKAYNEYEKYKIKQRALEKEKSKQEYIEDITSLEEILKNDK